MSVRVHPPQVEFSGGLHNSARDEWKGAAQNAVVAEIWHTQLLSLASVLMAGGSEKAVDAAVDTFVGMASSMQAVDFLATTK